MVAHTDKCPCGPGTVIPEASKTNSECMMAGKLTYWRYLPQWDFGGPCDGDGVFSGKSSQLATIF
jgi:hypothetical protein